MFSEKQHTPNPWNYHEFIVAMYQYLFLDVSIIDTSIDAHGALFRDFQGCTVPTDHVAMLFGLFCWLLWFVMTHVSRDPLASQLSALWNLLAFRDSRSTVAASAKCISPSLVLPALFTELSRFYFSTLFGLKKPLTKACIAAHGKDERLSKNVGLTCATQGFRMLGVKGLRNPITLRRISWPELSADTAFDSLWMWVKASTRWLTPFKHFGKSSKSIIHPMRSLT